MFLSVDLTSSPPAISLEDARNLRELKVVARALDGRDDARLDKALGAVGDIDADGNAWLGIDQLKELAGSEVSDEAWLEGYDAMIEYASSHDWVDAELRAVRAHCEWLGS